MFPCAACVDFSLRQKKYTRNLIASVPGSFCLMLLCWNPEKGSPIHNHAGSEWSVATQPAASAVPGSNSMRLIAICLRVRCSSLSPSLSLFSASFLRVVAGKVIEQQYVIKGGEGDLSAQCNWNKLVSTKIPASDLTLTHTNEYAAGGVTFINDSIGVHAVQNPFPDPAVTLHCYIPGYDTCKSFQADCTDSAHDSVKVQQCHISFDSEQGERTHN